MRTRPRRQRVILPRHHRLQNNYIDNGMSTLHEETTAVSEGVRVPLGERMNPGRHRICQQNRMRKRRVLMRMKKPGMTVHLNNNDTTGEAERKNELSKNRHMIHTANNISD